MDVNSRNREKFEIFGPPCRNALADLDGSTQECAQVCAVHIGLHLVSLRKIEMVAVLCTNETTPQFFWVFNSPSPHPPGADGHQRGRGHVGRHCPYTNNLLCGSVQALLRYRSKTAKMQKFPIDSHSNKNFISPFFRPPGAANPQKGRRHIQNQSMPACKIWRELARGLSRNRWQKNEQNSKSKKNTSPFALTSEWRVKTHRVGFLKKTRFFELCKIYHPVDGWSKSSLSGLWRQHIFVSLSFSTSYPLFKM